MSQLWHIDINTAAKLDRPQWREALVALITLRVLGVISDLTMREFYERSGFTRDQAVALLKPLVKHHLTVAEVAEDA